MKKIDLDPAREFHPEHMKKFLVHDSAYFRIINFNLAAGVVFPVHSHDLEGQLSILVIEGEGEYLGKDEAVIPAKTGDILISDIREPHGAPARPSATGSCRRPAACPDPAIRVAAGTGARERLRADPSPARP